MMSWLVNIKYFNTWKTNLRQPYCKDKVSGFLLMVYTSLLQTGNERYQLINSEFKVAFLRYWTFSQLFFLNSCKVSYWSLLGSLFLVFYHRLGLCRFSQIEKKTQFCFFPNKIELQRNSENFHFIATVSICSEWSILDSVLGTRPSIMAETVPPGCAAYSSLFPFCQCSSLRNMFGRKGCARQKCRFSSLPSHDVLFTVEQQRALPWLVCILPFPEISCCTLLPQQAPAHKMR